MTRSRARTAVVIGAGLGAIGLALPAGAGPAAPSPGAAGIGDPYYPIYGNGGYEVDHYDIHVAYDPDSLELTGHTVVEATATQDLSRFDLDLLLDVSRVWVDGEPAQYRQRGVQELVVTPPQSIAAGESFRVAVDYSGVPSEIVGPGSIQTWVTTSDGAVAVGEPEIAAWWYPSNDHPRDPAMFDIAVTVPKGVEAISNGTHTGTEPAGAGRRTWTWAPAEPMATYLAFMAIGQYAIEEGTDGGGRPYLYAFSKQLTGTVATAARRSLRQTARLTRFLEARFGPYPFDQVGGVVPGGSFGYALENQTRPTYSPAFFGGTNPYVVVHEMAHQWYGDAVTVHNWPAQLGEEHEGRLQRPDRPQDRVPVDLAETRLAEPEHHLQDHLESDRAHGVFDDERSIARPARRLLAGDPGDDRAVVLQPLAVELGPVEPPHPAVFFAAEKDEVVRAQHRRQELGPQRAVGVRVGREDLPDPRRISGDDDRAQKCRPQKGVAVPSGRVQESPERVAQVASRGEEGVSRSRGQHGPMIGIAARPGERRRHLLTA